jgi:hypothetical protein
MDFGETSGGIRGCCELAMKQCPKRKRKIATRFKSSPLTPQETVFKAYNGSVHKWVTFNEPVVFCSQASLSAPLL